MLEELREGLQLEQVLSGRRRFHDLMFQHPGEVVWDEDGVETCPQRRVDIGTWTVADHPCAAGIAAVMGGEGEVGFIVLLGQHLDSFEVSRQAGAVELSALFGGIAFGYKNQPMTGGELRKGLSDAGKKFYLLLCDGIRKAENASPLFIGGRGA